MKDNNNNHDGNGTTKNVLVFEDEPSISQACWRMLTKEGFKVEIADDEKIAQNMMMEKQHDLCLINLETTNSGKTLYKWITEKNPSLSDRVVFTIGDSIDSETRSFLKKIAKPFIPKPLTSDKIKSLLRFAQEKEM